MPRPTCPPVRGFARTPVQIALALGALGLAGACAAPRSDVASLPGADAAKQPGAPAVSEAADNGGSRGAAKLIVSTGWEKFRVDIREVALISGMVIVVRQDVGHTSRDRRALDLDQAAPETPDDTALAFRGPAYEDIAVQIARDVAKQVAFCDDGVLNLRETRDGDPSRLYRADHQAWVVFADCDAETV